MLVACKLLQNGRQALMLDGGGGEEFRQYLGMILRIYLRQQGVRAFLQIQLNKAYVSIPQWYHYM